MLNVLERGFPVYDFSRGEEEELQFGKVDTDETPAQPFRCFVVGTYLSSR